MKRLILLVSLLLTVSVTAQDKPAQPAPYTEVEALKIQVVNLEGQIVQRAVADWQKKVAALKAELESKRSGFVWNPETGEWAAVTPPVGEKKKE